MIVWVTWDPLYQTVLCVHKTKDGVCDRCVHIEENRDIYPLITIEYEVKE